MLELLAYLRANGFKTYGVSGGGIEFIRPLTESVASTNGVGRDPGRGTVAIINGVPGVGPAARGRPSRAWAWT